MTLRLTTVAHWFVWKLEQKCLITLGATPVLSVSQTIVKLTIQLLAGWSGSGHWELHYMDWVLCPGDYASSISSVELELEGVGGIWSALIIEPSLSSVLLHETSASFVFRREEDKEFCLWMYQWLVFCEGIKEFKLHHCLEPTGGRLWFIIDNYPVVPMGFFD